MPSNSLQLIEKRFKYNMERVADLLRIAQSLKSEGKPKSSCAEVLRASIVLLHASLEDLLREALRNKPPLNDTKFVGSLRLEIGEIGQKGEGKFSMTDLIAHKEKRVSELIDLAVKNHLERSSFNNQQQITTALKYLQLDVSEFGPYLGAASDCAERRHHIVHRSDRDDLTEINHGKRRHISFGQVDTYAVNVHDLGKLVISRLKESEQDG